MTMEFLVAHEVWTVLKELSWGDRFGSDLSTLVSDPRCGYEFEVIANILVESGIVYRFRGGQGSSYLSLTDKGQAIVGRFLEIEELLSEETIE
jgi:hypothetical protein